MARSLDLEAMLNGSVGGPRLYAELCASGLGTDAASVVAAIATADATDLATALVLANATKAKVNEVIAAFKASLQMKSS